MPAPGLTDAHYHWRDLNHVAALKSRKLEKLPLRERYTTHGTSVFVAMCTLASLLGDDEIAAKIWEAL